MRVEEQRAGWGEVGDDGPPRSATKSVQGVSSALERHHRGYFSIQHLSLLSLLKNDDLA